MTDEQKMRAERQAHRVLRSAMDGMADAQEYDTYLAEVMRLLGLARVLNRQLMNPKGGK
jgi:hypothetical protein